MKITLRKANAIQVAINEVLKSLDFNTNAQINEFQNANDVIDQTSRRFAENVKRRNNLLATLYQIRKSVSVANSQNGIESRLADVARLEKDITFFSQFAKAQPKLEKGVIEGKIAKIKSRTDADPYRHYESEVVTSVLEAKDIESFKAVLNTAKKQKQKLQDELLELNVRSEIQLAPESVEVLTREEIL